MNYKNCTHYNEVVRVLSENGSLEDVNFKLEDNIGCECKTEGDSVCELWVTLAFAHDMAPQLGIAHAEQTIANLDKRMKEITTMMVSNVGYKPESVEETETISETNIDSQLFVALPEEKRKLIEQLLEMGDVRFVKSDASRNELIVKAISEMDLEQLEMVTKNYLSEYKRAEFLNYIKSKFNEFKENNDTHLIAHSGSCSASDCNIGVSGYTFIGNNSNTYCNIIFEQENGVCTDIFKCSSFKVDDIFINKAREKKLDSYIFTDEELDDLPF